MTGQIEPREAASAVLQHASTLPRYNVDELWLGRVQEVTAAALAGDPVPADLLDRLAADRARAMAANDLVALLGKVAASLNALGDQVERDRVPETFLRLDAEVREILAAAAVHAATLGPARTPAAVMAAGDEAVAAWRALDDLARRYAEIRATQLGLAVKVGAPKLVVTAEAIAKFGIMRDVDDLWPGRADATLGRGNSLTGGPLSAAPWPHRNGDPWQIDHGVDFLLWAVDAGAELWVPTREQLQGAADEASKVVSQRRAEHGQPIDRKKWTRLDLSRHADPTPDWAA